MTFFCTGMAARNDQQKRIDSLRKTISAFDGEKKLEKYMQTVESYFYTAMDTVLFSMLDDMDSEALKQENYDYLYKERIQRLKLLINRRRFDAVIDLSSKYLAFFRERGKETSPQYYSLYYFYIISLSEFDISAATSKTQELFEHAKAMNNRQGMAITRFMMSEIYKKQLRKKEQEEALKESLALFDDCDFQGIEYMVRQAHMSYCYLLAINSRSAELSTALEKYKKIIGKIEKVSGIQPEANDLWELYAIYYVITGQYDSAEIYFNKQDSLNQASGGQFKSMAYRAFLLTEREQYDMAIEMTDRAMKVVNPNDKLEMAAVLALKMNILSNIKDADAKEVSQLAGSIIDLKDAINNKEFARQIDELHTQYKVEEHKRQTQKMVRYIIIAGIIIAFLLITLILWVYYTRLVNIKNFGLIRKIKEQDVLFAELKLKLEQEQNRNVSIVASETGAGTGNYTTRDNNFVRLDKLLKKNRRFTDPDLSRQKVATELGINERALYDCVKSNTGMNFNNYISYLRMAYAREQLANKQLTLEGIALEAGFGSRITFYRLFKDSYGLSPDEYRKLSADKRTEIINLAEKDFDEEEKDNENPENRRP
jgi:AraC-like DNA-binding protein